MQNRNIATTFLKGLNLLRAFEQGARVLNLADLEKRTGYDRATVRRLCLTLVEAGFMAQSKQGYQLAPGILTLAGSFLQANEIGQTIQPLLNQHATELGREISLIVRDGDRAMYVAQSMTGDSRISLGMTIGSTLPLLATAGGRMILAGLPGEERQPLIESLPLVAHTQDTCLNRNKISDKIDEASQARVCTVSGEFETNITGVAVPVDYNGVVAAVLGTTLPMALSDHEAQVSRCIATLQIVAIQLGRLNAIGHWTG